MHLFFAFACIIITKHLWWPMSTTLMNVFKNTLSPCVTWPASSCTSDVRAGSTDRWCWSCVVLRTVLQLPEPRRKVAEVFVVQRCLGWQPVLWEALEEPGGQLLRMVHVAQPDTNKDTWSEIDRKHTYTHSIYRNTLPEIKTQETNHFCFIRLKHHLS